MSIQETLLKLLIKNPFYGYLASRMTIRESYDINKIRVTVIPNLVLSFNPDWLITLNDNEKIGAVLHELMHIVLLHPFRRGDRQPALWAVACDIAVNQYINEEYIRDDSVTLDIISREIKAQLPAFESSEYYYSILEGLEVKLSLGGSDRDVLIVLESDRDLTADIIEDQETSPAQLSALKSEVVSSMENSGSNEEMSGELVQVMNTLYHEYQVNWKAILKRFLSTRGKVNKRKSYKRVSRRFDFLPGNIRSKGVEALVALDESGSMSDDLINIYIKELKEINRITGVSIKVVRFDTECSEPVSLSEYIKNTDRERRGGTDFRPVFELAEKMKMPLVIIFTDGEGDAPVSVNQKVLWLLTKGGRNPSNFGDAVYFTS